MRLIAKLLGAKEFDPAALAEKKDNVYTITPAEFYPAMVQHIRTSIQSEDLPPELIDRRIRPDVDPALAARRYRAWAKRIPDLAWHDALVPLSAFDRRHYDRIQRRAEALECARLWWTRALKNAEAGPPLGIRILEDINYRLGVNTQFRA